jgi:hypothetical protein
MAFVVIGMVFLIIFGLPVAVNKTLIVYRQTGTAIF